MQKLVSGLFVLAACLITTALFAAPTGSNSTGVAPVDGGAFALLAAVAGYGYWKLRGDKKSDGEKEA